jgi:hypothetical protein
LAVNSKDNSIVYLFGAQGIGHLETNLQVTIINISDISRPIVQETHTEISFPHWVPSNEKSCYSFLRTSNSPPEYPILIQQFGRQPAQQIIYLPEVNKFGQFSKFVDNAFLSRQSYAIVGQAGFNAWAMVLGNNATTHNDTTWSSLQLDARIRADRPAIIL